MAEHLGDSFWKDLLDMEMKILTGTAVEFDRETCANILQLPIPTSSFISELMDVARNLVCAEYDQVLNSKSMDTFFNAAIDSAPEGDLGQRISAFERSIKLDFNDNKANSRIVSLLQVFFGVAALQEFVRCNWTGPSQNKIKDYHLVTHFFRDISDSKCEAMKLLAEDGEVVSNNVLCPELLLLAKILISTANRSSCIGAQWWQLRCLMMQQHILEENSASIHDSIRNLITDTIEHEVIKVNNNFKTLALLEAVRICLYYHEVVPAKKYLTMVKEIVGMGIELSGAIGKRTKFQSKSLSQLFVKIKQSHVFPNAFLTEQIDTPEDLILDDEVLLSEVKFTDENIDVTPRKLGHLEQVVLLAECSLHHRSDASEELLVEELLAYVQCLLAQPSLWSIKIATLLMRSRVEKKKSRKVERAMMQLESIIDSARKDVNTIHQRQCFFYAVQFPPMWIVEKELGDALVSLGCIKSALEIYERLDLWDDIVNCHQVLGHNEKAASLVRKRLEIDQNATLWCILGDVTDDIQCYEKALEISEQNSTRAHRSLGYYYYKKKDYMASIPHFKKALELNHLQLNVWFSTAYACTMEKDYDSAAQSYRHVVNMDPENFEAWNNLSNAYIKLNQKSRAYKTLREALKCNYENWRVWENFLLVCVDVGAFEDAMNAYHRLLDIRNKHEDIEILQILVTAISTDVVDFSGLQSSRFRSKLLQLFGRLTSIVTNSSKIWKLYSIVYASDPENKDNKETVERILSYRQKSLKYAIHDDRWVREEDSCKTVLLDAIELGDIYLSYMKTVEDSIKTQSKTSARLALRNIVTRVQKQMIDFKPEFKKEIEEHLLTLKNKLEDVESA